MSGTVLWLTGLPCTGKTTLACLLRERLTPAVVLDGDEVRHTLNADLGFSPEDRNENLRRITEVAKVVLSSVPLVVVAAVSPTQAARRRARDQLEAAGATFVEVFVDAPLAVCERRDTKGMYARARAGELMGFTGVDAPYEPPVAPEVVCRTADEEPAQSAAKVVSWLAGEFPVPG